MPRPDTRPNISERGAGYFSLVMIVGGSFLAQIFVTINGVLTARMLGVQGRGELVLVTSLAAMASQITFGGSLPNAITRELARLQTNARDGLTHLMRRWTPWAAVPALVAGVLYLLVQHGSVGAHDYALAVAAAVLTMQTMSTRILIGAMLGEGTSLTRVAFTGMASGLFLAIVSGVAYALRSHWDPVEVVAMVIGCTAAALVLNVRWLAPRTGHSAPRVDGAALARTARHAHIGSVGPIDGLALDRTLVGSLLGSAQLGLYSAATAVAGLLTILGGAIAMLVLPRVVRLQGDRDAEHRFVNKTLVFAAVALAAVTASILAATDPIIRIAFGRAFLPATATAHWLVVASGLLSFRRVQIAVLQARGRGGLTSIIELTLTPVVVAGIVVASRGDHLVWVGETMCGVGLLSCVILGTAVARAKPAETSADTADERG